MRDIETALQEHKQAAIDAGYPEDKILGVFLYGSQNYGLATEYSDVDTKVIIIPSLADLCEDKRGFCKEYKCGEEKTVVMDILHYFDNLKKQNINYVETLYTEYKIINPIYEDIYNALLNIRELIAYYDMDKAVQSMGHQALHTLKQNSANPKKYAMAYYLAHFLSFYIEYPSSYEFALKQRPDIINKIKAIKIEKEDYTAEDVINLRKELEKLIAHTFKEDITFKKNIDEKLLALAIESIKIFDNL